MFGKILDADEGVLGDLKVTSSFKLMKALGIYKVKIDTGEVYKSGVKKGLHKFRTELRFDGVRGITKSVYIIPINKISDHWLTRYFQHKAKVLRDAINSNTLPPVCSVRERWNDRKCLGYCATRENCPHVQNLAKEANDDERLIA